MIYRFLALIIIFFIQFLDAKEVIKVGVLSFRDINHTYKQWEPTVAYLHEALPNYEFKLIPFYDFDFDKTYEKEKLNFVITNPEHFVLNRTKYKLNAIATLVQKYNNKIYATFGGVIFTRSDSKNINRIKDIEFKKIASPSKNSFGAYLVQIWELWKMNILSRDLNIYFTDFPQDRVVYDVLAKKADVGFVRTGVLESMIKEKKISKDDIKVLGNKSNEDFDMFLSTELYPLWTLLNTQFTSLESSKDVLMALFTIKEKSKAALVGDYYGFIPVKDYSKVEILMQTLRVHPDFKSKVTILDVIKKYYAEIMFSTILFLFLSSIVIIRILRDRKKIRDIARENELLLGSIEEGLYGTDEEGRCTFINNTALKMLGFSRDEIIGKNQHDLFHHTHYDSHDKYEVCDCPIYKTSRDGRIRNTDEVFFKKDGTLLFVHLIASPIFTDNKISGVMVAFGDIGASIKQKEELQNEKEKFEAIFNSSKDGIAILDLQSKFLEFNNAYLEMTGFSREELVTKTCVELTAPEDLERTKEALVVILNDGYIKDFEKTCITKNEKRLTITMSAVLMPDKNSILISTKDVTQNKLYTQQSKLASMGEMIGNIAHQWRQPLSVISSVASGVVVKSELNMLQQDEFVSEMKIVMKQAQYLSKTIDDFRNFIKESNIKERVDFTNMINQTISLVQSIFLLEGINIVTSLEQNFEIDGFENELIQAYINILNNAKDAIKYGDLKEEDRLIFLKTYKNEDGFVFDIYDSGGGISQEIIERIFEPYYTTKHKSIGTGLGLSMCRQIITEHHNAKIEAFNINYEYNNKAYKGACFRTLFPISQIR